MTGLAVARYVNEIKCYDAGGVAKYRMVELNPSVLGCIFLSILLIISRFYTASETHVWGFK